MSEKYKDGAFVFYRVSSQCQPMTPADIERLAAQHSLPASIVPEYAGDRQQVSRAIGQGSAQVSKQGWMLRPIKQTRHEVVYGVVLERKDKGNEILEHNQEGTMHWTDEHGNGAHITHRYAASHSIIDLVDAAYQALRGKICPGDWTGALTTYLVQECYAQAVRDDGRIYWCAPAYVARLAPLTDFLGAVGISLVVCELEANAVSVVQEAAAEGLADQLARLTTDVAALQDGEKHKPSNHKRRLADIVDLRKRAMVYQATLGIATESVAHALAQLEAATQQALTLSLAGVVPPAIPQAPQAPRALSDAIATTTQPLALPRSCQPLDAYTPPAAAYQQAAFTW